MTTLDQKIAEIFNSNFNLGGDWPWGNLVLCAIALFLCVVLCGLIGLEREKRGRSAGLRTHLLVGLGSCIIMIISIYGFPAGLSRDVARLAAQVITGVGFLGAGCVIHFQGGIKGLTTAGTIWLVMAVGLACGSMNFILALAATLIVMVVLVVFRKLETTVTKGAPQFIILADENVPVMTKILAYAKEHDYLVSEVSSRIVKDGNLSYIETTFKLSNTNKEEIDVDIIKNDLEKATKAINVQTLNHH